MIAGPLIADGAVGNDEIPERFFLIQYPAGSEEDKRAGAHGRRFFESSGAGGTAYAGEVKGHLSAAVRCFEDGNAAACGRQKGQNLRIRKFCKSPDQILRKSGNTGLRKAAYFFYGVGRMEKSFLRYSCLMKYGAQSENLLAEGGRIQVIVRNF